MEKIEFLKLKKQLNVTNVTLAKVLNISYNTMKKMLNDNELRHKVKQFHIQKIKDFYKLN